MIPHAGNCEIEITGQVTRQLDWDGKPIMQLLWDKRSQIDGERRGIENLNTIGAPYLYYLINKGIDQGEIKENLKLVSTNWTWSNDLESQIRFIDSRRVLVLPKHSWQGDIQVRNSQISKLLDLRNYAESLGFCLGYIDYLDPKTQTFYGKELGVELYCAGISSTEVPYSPIPARVYFHEIRHNTWRGIYNWSLVCSLLRQTNRHIESRAD